MPAADEPRYDAEELPLPANYHQDGVHDGTVARGFPRTVTKVLGAMQRVDENGKRYTDYGFEVYLLGSNWQIYKRYSQFDELRRYLLKKYSAVVDRAAWPVFPVGAAKAAASRLTTAYHDCQFP